VLRNVIQLTFHIRVEEPVQADGPIIDPSSLDGLVIQIEVAKAHANLPRTTGFVRVPLFPVVILQRHHSAEDALAPDVILVLASQEAQRLDIAAVVKDCSLIRSAWSDRVGQELTGPLCLNGKGT